MTLISEIRMKKITIIGGGNLGTAIALGLIQSEFIAAQNITVTKRNIHTLVGLGAAGVHVTTDNKSAVRSADLIILAIKPFQVKEVLEEIAGEMQPHQIFVSVVTGVSLEELASVIKTPLSLFRAMPNTAIAIQQSMTCISSNSEHEAHVNYVSDLFCKLGKITFIDEKLMNAATVLGACGTAYAMRYIRANIQGGIEIGFDAATASLIAAQTVKGAAELLLTTHTHPEQEIDKVTTPKGCTIAGLNEMEHQGFSSSLIKGIVASYNKIG